MSVNKYNSEGYNDPTTGNADIFLDSMLIISGGDYVYLRRKD
mgnify:CR=1 FL=1